MSTIHDFGAGTARDRSNTGGSQQIPLSPLDRVNTGGSGARRQSNVSRRSSSFKHPARSTTVTTYHEPERSDPVWKPGAEPGLDTSAPDDQVPPEVSALKAECEI